MADGDMTVQQREYAMKRIDRSLRVIRNRLEEKHTKEAHQLSKKQKRKLIEEGDDRAERVGKTIHTDRAPRKFRNAYHRPDAYIVIGFDFPEQTNKKLDKEAYEAEVAPYEKRALRAKDNIMLGDAERGLEIVQNMEDSAESLEEDQ